jgi:hypothetical protein
MLQPAADHVSRTRKRMLSDAVAGLVADAADRTGQ